MSLPGEKFWPFPILPEADRTNQQRAELRFLQAAYDHGLRPSVHDFGYSVRLPDETREADVIRRMPGRDWWELVLYGGQPPRRLMSGFVTGFEQVTVLAIQWARGIEDDVMWERLTLVGSRIWRESSGD